MSVIQSAIKVSKQLAVCFGVAGCAGGNMMANIDPGVAAAAGAALGYGLGNEVNDEWGGYVGGAVGAAVANAASNSARACQTDTSLDRYAERDNTTGRVGSDYTTQSQSKNCTTYGGNQIVGPNQPIFRNKTPNFAVPVIPERREAPAPIPMS